MRSFARWLNIVPIVALILLGCGQLAIARDMRFDRAEVTSGLRADYSPWHFAVIGAVRPEIIEERALDHERFPGIVPPLVPKLITDQVGIWSAPIPTPAEVVAAPTLNPTPTTDLAPETGLPTSMLPTATPYPTEPELYTPTSVSTWTQTPLPNATATANPPPLSGPPWWQACYRYRRQVEVQAGSAAVSSDYTVWVTLDHASLVSARKSRPNGDDVRIVHWTGAGWVELDRVVADGSAWNATATKIFFQLRASIGAGAAEGNYYVYYGCDAPGSPPSNALGVFWYFSDFSKPESFNDWKALDVNKRSDWFVGSGLLSQNSDADYYDQTPYVNGKLLLGARSTIRDLAVEYKYRPRNNDLAGIGLCSNDTSNQGFYVGQTKDDWFNITDDGPKVGYWVSDSDNDDVAVGFDEGNWYEVKVQWTSNRLSIWFNGSQVNTWNTGPKTANSFCFIHNDMAGVDFDDLRIRRFVYPEPSTTIRSEESQP